MNIMKNKKRIFLILMIFIIAVWISKVITLRSQDVGYAYFRIDKDSKYEFLDIIDANKVTEKISDLKVFEFNELKIAGSELSDGVLYLKGNTCLC